MMKRVLLCSLLVLTACTSPKEPKPPGLVESMPETLNALGVRGIVGGVLRDPASSTIRGLHQVSATIVSLLHPGMETFANGTGPEVPLSRQPPMNVAAFEAELDRKLRPIKARGTVKPLIDGDQFFPALTSAIRQASAPIDVQVYIFDNDDVAVRVADELKAASRRVPVRVLFDDLGSLQAARVQPMSKLPRGFQPPSDILTYLKEDSKVDARRLRNVFLTSSHTKLITIGDSKAFIGGMNIGREYRYDWHDMMLELRGPIVRAFKEEFRRSYAKTDFIGDTTHSLSTPSKHGRLWRKSGDDLRGAFDIRILHTKPFDPQIESAIHLAIQHAQRRIWIEDPYLADDRLVGALIGARERGVDVRVVLPNKSDAKIMGASNRATAAVLLKHGIRVYTYPGVHHVKAALFDGWALTGSANLDHLSLRLNDELNIAYSHPRAVRELESRLFQKDFRISTEESVDTLKPDVRNAAAEILADHL